MSRVEIVLPLAGARRWHVALAERLSVAGRRVSLTEGGPGDHWPAILSGILAMEARLSRRGGALWEQVDAGAGTAGPAQLTVDLSGGEPRDGALSILFDGHASASAAAEALLRGRLPRLEVVFDGSVIARGEPMVDGRIQTGRGLDDVLARAITMLETTALRLLAGEEPAPLPPADNSLAAAAVEAGLPAALALRAMPRAAAEVGRRLTRWPAHWRVGYRFHDGAGVAELGQLGGPEWSILPDDGSRYYADPFAFEHAGRHFIFVEEYPHHTGKGILSVSEFDADGRPSVPRVVLEEPHHLSYPQIFAVGGEVFMLPEAGASNALTLYRATRFPDEWRPHAVLLEGRALYDATLLEHGGKLWLLACERDGAGSTSDLMVAFHAERLEGPWRPHRANPIAIDRASARQGGAFARVGRRIVRPVQDGTQGYGGGLGLSDLVRLDEQAVEFSRPVGILGMESWPYPRIHTLNRAGSLEVIDGLAEVRRVRERAA
jgi:hypothetical protein